MRIGRIEEISGTKARVEISGQITAFLPFLYIPIENQVIKLDYKKGDIVGVSLNGSMNSGVIVGKVSA